MGEEIDKDWFGPKEFARFRERLAAETALLRRQVDSGRFAEGDCTFGFEVEAWLVDHGYFPSPVNEVFLKRLDNPMVVPELSRFNVELNTPPLALGGRTFSEAAATLRTLFQQCNDVAHCLDANMVLIGTLPTIREQDLTLANMSPLKRYFALNSEVVRRRHGRPLRIDIRGRDHLVAEHMDVMLEAATTSFQAHLKVPASRAHLYYNAAIMVSAPVLAACTNSPFLFGRQLWEETRIPLFEQSVALPGSDPAVARVSFGSGYAAESLVECFMENLQAYSPLLPPAFDEAPEAMRHLRFHNGTIWRWNRPLIGFEADGQPHFRIENRILPSGPSIADMLANAALVVGLVQQQVLGAEAGEVEWLSFETARTNFYAVAQAGLDAVVDWTGGVRATARDLLLERLLSRAREGLHALGITPVETAQMLEIIERRVRLGQTGSAWQRAFVARHGDDRFELMAAYCERQRSGLPVHEWAV